MEWYVPGQMTPEQESRAKDFQFVENRVLRPCPEFSHLRSLPWSLTFMYEGHQFSMAWAPKVLTVIRDDRPEMQAQATIRLLHDVRDPIATLCTILDVLLESIAPSEIPRTIDQRLQAEAQEA